ncbi:C39 family peptidase [Bradyrhizobium sp. HKCCYLS2058]|uniref:C39 family peptidase n=1 Tax=Bradyrhizobium TaxID=374 RepID=UPI003EB80FAF
MATIPVEQARSVAMFHAASKSAPDIADRQMARFFGSDLDPNPIIIFDLTGTPAFYDFSFYQQALLVGVIRCTADTRLQSAAWAFEPPSRQLSDTNALKIATEAMNKIAPDATLVSHSFVAYSYAKIGVRVSYVKDGHPASFIVDYYDRSVLTQTDLAPSPPPVDLLDSIDGLIPHSILDSQKLGFLDLSEPEPLRGQSEREMIRSIVSGILPESGDLPDIKFDDSDYKTLQAYFAATPPAIASSILPVPLFAQITPVYCAVASAQMILAYFGFTATPEQIAEQMKPGPKGATNKAQVSAYQFFAGGRLAPTFDQAPSFDHALDALQKFIPFKSGLPGHARVCRGWKQYSFVSSLTGNVTGTEHYFLINDPYPVGEGSIRWENLKNHNYANAISFSRMGGT